jgi:drug/metabolite transporter (DMT)-like permease
MLPGDKSSSSIGTTTVNSIRNDTNYFDTSLSIENGKNDNSNNIDDNTFTITNNNSSANNTLEIWGIPLQSILLLNLVAIIWGTQHAVIKSVIDDNITPTKLSFFLDGSSSSSHSIIQAVVSTLQPFISAAASSIATVVGENNDVGDMLLDSSSTTDVIASSSSSSTAAYFTLARFGIAAILSSPYTPGVRQIMDHVQERLFTTAQQQQQQQQPDSLSTTTATTKSISSDSSSTTTNNGSSSSITTAWRYGFELGIYMFLGYAFQAIGLETTTASRSGFLLYLNVKLVPFFAYILYGKTIATRSWVSAIVAFIGTSLLALDNNGNGSSISLTTASTITVGDLWSIAAAATSAIFILRMESASREVDKSSELNAATLWTVTLLSLIWTMTLSIQHDGNTDGSTEGAMVMVDVGTMSTTFVTIFIQSIQHIYHETILTITQHFIPLLYLSGITTALANYIQSKAQQNISAERASIIYAMDPVYGAIFANLLLGETLGKVGIGGALLIVLAAVTNAIVDFGNNNNDGDGDDVNNDRGNN